MIVEYWLAGYLGRTWLALHAMGKRPGSPEGCRLVARGRSLPAGELLLAQSFASRAWTLTTAFCGALFFATAVGGAALPDGLLRAVALYAVIFFIVLTTIAGIAMCTVIYRVAQTRQYVLRGKVPVALEIAMPRGGQPRTRDFWIGLAFTAVCFSGVIYLQVMTQ